LDEERPSAFSCELVNESPDPAIPKTQTAKNDAQYDADEQSEAIDLRRGARREKRVASLNIRKPETHALPPLPGPIVTQNGPCRTLLDQLVRSIDHRRFIESNAEKESISPAVMPDFTFG